MSEILSVKEMRNILLEIDNCQATIPVTFADGENGDIDCCMQHLCDECIERMTGLLEWAEDMENEQADSAPSC